MSDTIQKYEIMAIIDQNLDEKAAEQYAQEGIAQKITKAKGKITFEDFWGARGFAYRIKKQTWGYYMVFQFELERAQLEELKKDWTIDKKIVRYLISKVSNKMPEPKKYEDMKKEWAALEKEQKIKEMEEKKPARPVRKAPVAKPVVEEKTETEEKEAPKTETKPKETKENKDALDKKLDKILEDSSLDL